MERVHPGMKVMTLDGQHLGKVAEVGEDSFVVEHGGERLPTPAEEVAAVLDRELFLRLPLRVYLDRQRRKST